MKKSGAPGKQRRASVALISEGFRWKPAEAVVAGGTEPAVGSATLLNWASRLLRMFDLVAGEMGWKVLTEFAAPKQSRAILCWNYNCPGVLINELRTRKIAQDNAEGWEGF